MLQCHTGDCDVLNCGRAIIDVKDAKTHSAVGHAIPAAIRPVSSTRVLFQDVILSASVSRFLIASRDAAMSMETVVSRLKSFLVVIAVPIANESLATLALYTIPVAVMAMKRPPTFGSRTSFEADAGRSAVGHQRPI